MFGKRLSNMAAETFVKLKIDWPLLIYILSPQIWGQYGNSKLTFHYRVSSDDDWFH